MNSRIKIKLNLAISAICLALLTPTGTVSATDIHTQEVELDFGFITPFGVDVGAAWSPVSFVEFTGQFGVIAFYSDTEYDSLYGSGLLKDMGAFLTYGFGFRLRYLLGIDRLGKTWRGKIFGGLTVRDFLGTGGGGQALDCLYCSDWSAKLDYPFNRYLVFGGEYRPVSFTFEYRLTDNAGKGVYSGDDPYDVGTTWYREWDTMETPKVIVRVAYSWVFGF